MYNNIKDMYNNLNYKEQKEIYKVLESKQNNIVNDFRIKEKNQIDTDYSWESGNNILEPIADLIFNVITAIFPEFKKNN